VEDKKLAALLSYLLGWITGIIFLLIEKDSYVRFHAVQSIFTFGILDVLIIILSILASIGLALGGWGVWLVLHWIIDLIWLLSLVLWILLMIKAYQGERFKLPIVGDIAEKYAA
jgi:uncharacterized membrane protein